MCEAHSWSAFRPYKIVIESTAGEIDEHPLTFPRVICIVEDLCAVSSAYSDKRQYANVCF